MKIYFSLFVFLATLSFFRFVDVYHQHFFDHGFLVVCYQLFREIFILSSLWLCYAAGDLFLSWVNPEYKTMRSLPAWLFGVLTGIGLWQITLFALGLSGFLNVWVLIGLSLLLWVKSLPRMSFWLNRFSSTSIYWPGMMVVAVPASLFLLTKGLYPAGGHDYYNHYFHFYRQVIESGSILPNAIWYHFYYSKGAGLFFWGMLLTDPLAPQLISTALVITGAMMVYSLLVQKACWRLLPWIGVALYLAFLISTPGPTVNLHEGGWGDMEKPHEPVAVLMLAILWLTMQLHDKSLQRLAGFSLIFTIISVILFSAVTVLFVGAFLGLCWCYTFINRQYFSRSWLWWGMVTAGFTLLSIEFLNYYVTGLPDDQNLNLFWPILDVQKLQDWGVLFETVMLYFGKQGMSARQDALNLDYFLKTLTYLRLDIWWPLLLTAFIFIPVMYWQRKRLSNRHIYWDRILVLTTFLVMVWCSSLVLGRAQPISFYRFTSFTYAPMLCLCLLILAPLLTQRFIRAIVLTVLVIAIYLPSHLIVENSLIEQKWEIVKSRLMLKNVKFMVKQGRQLLVGNYSLHDAYQHQLGWPGRLPWGGINPAMESVWQQIPKYTRVWSLHDHTYCMLPDCHVESFMSYQFTKQADLVYTGTPEKAKQVLIANGLNYFFISTELKIKDPVIFSQLFASNNLAKYMGVVWTDGKNTLLTWKENAPQAIDAQWLQDYAASAGKLHQSRLNQVAFTAMAKLKV